MNSNKAVLTDEVCAAMKKAYNYGKTYWQQADSEYVSQHKKADVTAGRFIELNDEICAKVEAAVLASADSPSTAGATEPELMGIDESREYIVEFMEQHFTDKTFHRYIRGQISPGGQLAGDFAWQLARALRMILAAPVAQSTAGAANGQRENKELARILFGMIEGGAVDRDTNIYADDYQAGDGDTYVYRAAEVLVEQDAEIDMLLAAINLLSEKLAAAPAPHAQPEPAAQVPSVERLEQIAQSWDECKYDAVGETLDIGAMLREQFKSVHAAAESSAAQVPTAAEARNQALEEVAKLIEKKVEDYDRDHGSYDHTTGVTEYPGDGAEWVEEMESLAEEIRALRTTSEDSLT